MQEAFEKWAASVFSEEALIKSEMGGYINPYTRVAYTAFQAGWIAKELAE